MNRVDDRYSHALGLWMLRMRNQANSLWFTTKVILCLGAAGGFLLPTQTVTSTTIVRAAQYEMAWMMAWLAEGTPSRPKINVHAVRRKADRAGGNGHRR